MTQYAIVTDLNRCVGCLACMVACKAVNETPIGAYRNKILRIGPTVKENATRSSDVEMYYLSVQCQHCANPECVTVCPTSASFKAEDGTIQIDEELCIGCQSCMTACPYGARYLNEDLGVVQKCSLCADIISEGGLPQCVSQCGGRARFYGDLDAGLDSFVGAGKVSITEDSSYDAIYNTFSTYSEIAKPYGDEDVYHLTDVGNEPSCLYILRNHEWKGEAYK